MRWISVLVFIIAVVVGSCTKKLPPLNDNQNPPCDTCSTDTVYFYCSDTGRTGYFPTSVGSWWAYQTIKGSSLNPDSTGVSDTLQMWAETTRVVDDSTWINTYYGGPYNGFQDTFYVYMRGDTIFLKVKYIFKPPLDTTTIPINLDAPFGIYPLIPPMRWESAWDTLPPANYIGGSNPDTIAYKLSALVKNDTLTIILGSENLCAQKVEYSTHVHIIYTDGYGSGSTLKLPSFMFWIPYKGIGRRLEIDLRDTTGGFPNKWLQKNLTDYYIRP